MALLGAGALGAWRSGWLILAGHETDIRPLAAGYALGKERYLNIPHSGAGGGVSVWLMLSMGDFDVGWGLENRARSAVERAEEAER